MPRKPVIIEGRRYESRQEAAEAHGLDPDRVARRVSAGMSVEEALTTPVQRKAPIPITINGTSYASIAEAARACRIPAQKLRDRLASGYSPEQAADPMFKPTVRAKKHHNNRPVTVHGTEFHTITEAAKAYSMTPTKLYERLLSGLTPEQAVDPDKYKSVPVGEVTVRGVAYPNVNRAANAVRVNESTLRRRLRRANTRKVEEVVDPVVIDAWRRRRESAK